MKQILNVLMMTIVMGLTLTACSSSTATPKDAAMKAANLLKSGNYEAFVDNLVFDETVAADKVKEQKAMLTAMLKEKIGKSIEKKGEVTDLELVSETISEDGNSAKVLINFVHANGDKEEYDFDLKNIDGEWKPVLEK